MLKHIVLAAFLALPATASTVTLLHFSDYHSHALPFYSEEGPDRGGIARAIGYLSAHKRAGAVVLSGGDMINKGAPAWSDRYRCEEWKWLNGIVDAMAFGNHEADYGYPTFAACRDALTYPVLSANTAGFPPYAVVESNGIRIGAFALAGPDFPSLVRVPEIRFGDSVAAAREAVKRLRGEERVDAVVLIGHQHSAADFQLARAVPGIDVIFGSHSHLRQELTRIPGTETWFISPYQYLTWISRVELTFDEAKKLMGVTGKLVPVDASMPEDARIAARVAAMQKDLETDPRYRDLFVSFATLPEAMSTAEVGQRAVDIMRSVSESTIALSTASSFRQPLPPGAIDDETLRASLPYDNEIVVATLPAAKARELLQYARGQKGDANAFVAGEVVGETVTVATTDYLAFVAAGYRDFFAGAETVRTGRRVRAEFRRELEKDEG